MKKAFVLIVFLLFFLLAPFSFSEINGTINSSTGGNKTIVTGLIGYTVSTCTNDNSCLGYKCFLDYDAVGSRTTTAGTCNATSVTSCYHDDSSGTLTIVATGGKLCYDSTHYIICNSGAWGSLTACSSGQTCSGSGVCAASGSNASSSSGSTGTTGSTNATSSINITSLPSKVELVQGNSTVVNVSVKNTGDTILYSIVLSITGLNSSWYSISPSSIAVLSPANSNSFIVAFSLPSEAEVGSYSLIFSLTTNVTSVKASASMTLNVLPRPETYLEINKTYDEYVLLLKMVEENITKLENASVNKTDVEGVKSIIEAAKAKLNASASYISNNDYFNAKLLLDEAKSLIDSANRQLAQVKAATGEGAGQVADGILVFVIVGVVAIVIFIVVYMLWPSKTRSNLSIFGKK